MEIKNFLDKFKFGVEIEYNDSEKNTTHIVSEESVTNRSNFTTLAPTILEGDALKGNKVYIESLKEAIQIPENKNIALMGSYGAGKSSILKTFKEQNPKYEYLFLSLASFIERESNDKNQNSGEESVEKLEKWEKIEKILVKQMIYNKAVRDLPYSRFKRISNISNFALLFHAFLVFILIDLLTNNNVIAKMLETPFSSDNIVFGLIFSISLYIIYVVLSYLSKVFKLTKFSFKSFTIETSDDDTSYFSKYLDEIIYFFEVSKTNIVVIEDIDRFDSITIFEHLRELNYLLNNSDQIKQNVRFIYAVRDDLFNTKGESSLKESEEYLRTKFFDFIIPVIPVVDYSNSRDFLVPKVKSIIENNFSSNKESGVQRNTKNMDTVFNNEIERFLWSISLYIDDLRLIYNICNEFEVYTKKLPHINTTGKLMKLFSLIVYKNIYPEDFSALQRNYGNLYEIFKSIKPIILEARKEEIGDKIEENRKILEDSDTETRESIKLAIIRICLNHFEDSNINFIQYSKDTINIYSFERLFPLDDGKINDFLQVKEFIGLRYGTNTSNQIKISKEEINKYLHLAGVHSNKIIEELENEERKKIKQQIQQLEKEKSFITTLTIREIFENEYEKHSEITMNFPGYELLMKYLLSEGHIDETYNYYISNLYENVLNANDVTIIQKLKSNTPLNEEEELNDYELALYELTVNDYKKTAILNKKILLYIFNNPQYINEQKSIVNVFIHKTDETRKIELYRELFTETHDKTKRFVSMTLQENLQIFSELYKSEASNPEFNEEFIYRIFGTAEIGLLNTILGKDAAVESFVLSTHSFVPNLYEDYKVNQKELNEFFAENLLKFEDTGFPLMSESNFLYFVKKHLYQINAKNVFDIYERITSKSQDYFSLSELLATEIEQLTQHINDHFDEYVQLLNERESFYEEDKVLIRILNESEVSNDLKNDIIKNNYYRIDDIACVNDLELRRSIFQYEKYTVCLKNVMRATNEEHEFISSYFEDESMVRQFIDEASDMFKSDEDLKEEVQKFLIRLVNEYGQEVNDKNIDLFKYVEEYSTNNINYMTFETLMNERLLEPTITNINKLAGKNKVRLMAIDEATVSENFHNVNLDDREIILGITTFEGDLLDKTVASSFENGKLIVSDKVEWLEVILSRRIELNATQINNLFSYEEFLEDATILEYLIFIIPKDILPESDLIKNLTFIDKSLANIERGSYKVNRVDIKYYNLLTALVEEKIISSVKIENDKAVFYNKRK